MASSFVACVNNEEEEEDNTLRIARGEYEEVNKIVGYVADASYKRKKGVEIYFGENPELASTTNENGEFSFYYFNGEGLTREKLKDYIIIDSDTYKFKVIHMQNNLFIDNEYIILAESKDSEIDLSTAHLNREFRLSFGAVAQGAAGRITLPVGYPVHSDQEKDIVFIQEERLADEHHDTIFGVDVYLNGQYVCYSRRDGMVHIPYIFPQTEIKFSYTGMFFFVRHVPAPPEVLENNTYLYGANGNDIIIEFRGASGTEAGQQDLDILKNNRQWEEYLNIEFSREEED